MHCGDDLTFDTPGWDGVVREAFEQTPDKILFAYGNDLGPHGETFGTHGFVHRRWVETLGYFVPPLSPRTGTTSGSTRSRSWSSDTGCCRS